MIQELSGGNEIDIRQELDGGQELDIEQEVEVDIGREM